MRIYKKLYGRKTSPDYFSDNVEVPISISFSANPTYCNVSLATLKYDKDFAHSFTFDDSLVSAITSGYPILAGGVADDGLTYPALYYTDGCGNNLLFKAASAFYTVNSSGTDLHNGTPSNLTYTQLKTLYNAGWDIMNHSWSHANGTGDTPGYSLGRPNYSVEIENNRLAIQNNIVQAFPHFIIPAGDMNYLPAVLSGNTVAIYNQAGALFYGGNAGFRLDNIGMERPLKLFRVSRQETDTYPTIKSNIDSVAVLAVNGAKYWFNDFTHTITSGLTNGGLTISDFSSYMGYVASTYGAAGSDRVWMAPLQEVWEYNNLREKTILSVPSINNNTCNFSAYFNILSTVSRRFDWTIKVNTDQNITSVNLPNGYTTTFRGTGNTKIINISKLWDNRSGDYISRQSGNWNDTNSWYIKGFNGTLYPSPGTVPGIGNDVYIESGHTITQTSDVNCKNLNINTTVDVIRLNNATYNLNIYGKLRVYTGIAPGTSDGTGAGIAGYLGLGTLRFKGTTRTGIILNEFSPNANNNNVTVEIAMDAGQSLDFSSTVRFGYLNITSGTLTQNNNTLDIRLAGDGTALDPLNMQGILTIKSGTTLKGGLAVQRAATSAMKTMTLESGGTLWITRSGYFIGAQTLSLLGEVIMDATGTVTLPNNTGRSFAAAIDTYGTLTLQNTGTYTLQFDTTINSKLRRSSGATLSLNSKVLSYGSNADLEYVGTFTAGTEFQTNGSYNYIPRNLIVNGGILTLNGNKIIRGSIVLLNGGSINYNGFSISTPSFKSIQSGLYNSTTTWNMFDSGSTWVTSPTIPTSVNDIYIESGHTITQTTNVECNNINLNTTADVARFNNTGYNISVNGKMRFYTGSASGTSDATNGGINDWLGFGTFKFVGNSRIPFINGEMNASAPCTAVTLELNPNTGSILQTSAAAISFGNFTLRSGTFQALNNISLRARGAASSLTSTQTGGIVTLKSGSTFLTFTNSTTSFIGGGSTIACDTITLEAGAILQLKSQIFRLGAVNLSLLGEVIFDNTGTNPFINNTSLVGASPIDTYSTVTLQNTGTYTLQFNTTINTKLRRASGATLSLNSKTLSYGAVADLEYVGSFTAGTEFQTNGSGSTIPRNLIVNGGVLTLDGNKTIRGSVILLNGGSINLNGFTLNVPTMVSKQSGNYEDSSTWNILDFTTSTLVASTIIPTLYNDVYIESGHTVTLNQNNSCKTLNLNVNQDVVRINTGINELAIWGTLKSYDGTYVSNSFNAANAGIAGWITGSLVFTGNVSRTIMGTGQTITANARAAGWNMIIDFLSGTTATNDTSVVRCGNLTVRSGTLNILPYNSTGNEIRIAGMDYTAQPGDGINAGNVVVKSGAKLINNGRLIKNTPTSARNGLQNFTIESGGIYVSTLAAGTVPTISYSILGEVWLNQLYAQNFLDRGTNIDSIDISNYSTVLIGGSSAKTLRTNTTINTKLSFAESASTLSLSTFTLTYGTNADLEYTISRTKGVELINSGSGTAIPRNLILGAGVVLNLGGATVNIRGTLTLGSGASVTNGTLNQSQP